MRKISHLKCNFQEFSGKKTVVFFPAGPFFLVLLVNIYRNALIPRKLPFPKKFLVKRLRTFGISLTLSFADTNLY